jgi:hypothetical protein
LPAARAGRGARFGEPGGFTGVHEAVRRLSSRQLIVVGGALAAALAGAAVGAQARPAAALAGQTLGPRMDFDLAAHLPPSSPPVRYAAQPAAARGA